jgi:3-oxoacyl-[acyl-carrier protein] reductase
MDLQLSGKVAIVTGASRGIGAAIARGLAAEGCRLALCARGLEALDETAASISTETGAEVYTRAVDVTVAGEVEDFIEAAADFFGGLDILINNAGGNRRKPLVETTDEDWQAILELNVLGHLRACRAAIPHLKSSDAASIIFISSIFGREAGGPGLSIYNTTKSAIISAAKILSLELAPEGIRVNTIAPGSIRFPGGSWDRRVQEDPEGMEAFVKANIPLGRFGTAQEIADLAAYLSSPRASLITGACINADGGQSRSLI